LDTVAARLAGSAGWMPASAGAQNSAPLLFGHLDRRNYVAVPAYHDRPGPRVSTLSDILAARSINAQTGNIKLVASFEGIPFLQ
jgi:hypothetical protein